MKEVLIEFGFKQGMLSNEYHIGREYTAILTSEGASLSTYSKRFYKYQGTEDFSTPDELRSKLESIKILVTNA